MKTLAVGLHLICWHDCPTCVLAELVFKQLAASHIPVTIYSQESAMFPADVPGVVDDSDLEISYNLNLEYVPTLIRVEAGQETERIVGWNRAEW